MEDIFEMQMKLNVCTLGNIGLDFHRTMADPEQKAVWIENYRKALSSELAELVREVRENGLGTQNGQIEVVDLLHFLVTLSQILGISPQEVRLQPAKAQPASFSEIVIEAFLALDDLQNSVKWKWWARGGGTKPERARAAVEVLWHCLEVLCALLDMDEETVKKLYVEKNRVNFRRQAQGYNEDTKTEADNTAIRL